MARIDDLPPDQRAALQLLLKQSRSYEEIADMLRIEPRAVRERARSALDALGPEDVDDLELDQQDDIADYLLGQQSASRRAATREFLEQSAAGRSWARVVVGELRAGGHGLGDNLPDIPAEAAEVDEAFGALQARTAHRERAQRSSKLGGAILLAGLGVLVAGVLALALGLFGGDDDSDDERAATGTTSTQTSTTPSVEAQINLTPPEGAQGEAAGVAQIGREGNQRAVALAIQGLQRATQQRFYAVWLYTSPSKASFQGFLNPQPGKDGRVATGFPLPDNARGFRELVVTRETQERPKRPGTIVLRGALELPAG